MMKGASTLGLHSHRPDRPSFAPTPVSGHFAEDRYYRTGSGDPRLRFDPGAGNWNSHPKTAAVVGQRVALDAVVGGPTSIYPGPNATRHLRHYLNNTGLAYTIDLEDMVRSVPTAREAMVAEFRQAQAFIRTLPPGRHRFTSRAGENAYNYKQESADWFFAIGGYTYWGKGEARISAGKAGRHYAVDFEYHFADRYNWDGDKEVELGGMTITDEFMAEFHRQGLAREFDCFGSLKRQLAWDGDFGAPEKLEILRRQGR